MQYREEGMYESESKEVSMKAIVTICCLLNVYCMSYCLLYIGNIWIDIKHCLQG